jgi:hypothetical protein
VAAVGDCADATPEFLREHYLYEVNMMRATFAALQQRQPQHLGNALIESFALHARILMDFYLPKARGDDAIAAHFTATGCFVGHATAGMPPELRQKINKQITHLTYARVNASKLNQRDRLILLRLVELDHAAFTLAVSPEFMAAFASDAG